MTDLRRKRGRKDKGVSIRKPRRFGKVAVLLSVCFLVGVLWIYFGDSEPDAKFRDKAFARLVKIRETKKREVIEYLENVQRLARDIRDDPTMLHFFRVMNKEGYEQDADLEYLFDKHYVSKYDDFYDILLVDAQGFVLHSVRKESDYHTNLFTGPLAETRLVQQMKKGPDDHFVEYEYYSPSEEPAAFFASPLRDGAQHIGWFVLQCSVNHLNTVLADRKDLGRTGEVYLVNEEKWMLTDSRFVEDSTTLRLNVDTWAVREALDKGVGTRTIQDYRGVIVLSAFERFEIFGTSWMIICEIDEDEVITEHYTKYAEHYNKEILAYFAQIGTVGHQAELSDRKRIRVDLNEFAKAEPGERLETYGVATCTAVVVAYPSRFAYLAHIGPNDVIYTKGKSSWPFARDGNSDFVGELIGKIKHYDIYPYELKNLQFTIVATHEDSFGDAIRRIVESGVGLGNIKLIYNPRAGYANVIVDPAENLVTVIWTDSSPNARPTLVDAAKIEDLGTIVKRLAGYGA